MDKGKQQRMRPANEGPGMPRASGGTAGLPGGQVPLLTGRGPWRAGWSWLSCCSGR